MKRESKIKIADLFYYFDAQEKNRLDQGAIGRKSAEVLVLREKLLALPDQEFDAAIKTMRGIVSVSTDDGKPKTPLNHQKDALKLFAEASKNGSAGLAAPMIKAV